MEPIYRKQFEVSPILLDRYGRMKPSSVLYLAQEIAGQHCTTLALDYDTLAQQHLFWAVIRNRVQISRLPCDGESITVETWPMPTTRVAYPRSTVAFDEQGQELFRSIALWVLMDTRTRAMILPSKSGISVCGTVRGQELAVPNSIVPITLKNHAARTVCFSDLDRNGHLNNTHYLDWIDDLLPSAFHAGHPLREVTICYLHEAREGQTLHLDWELNDTLLQVEAHRENPDGDKPERVFAAQLEF